MSYNNFSPELQLVSSKEVEQRKYRLDPSQYNFETEKIIKNCKAKHIKLSSLIELGWIKEIYLPNRFNRTYTDSKKGIPMIGTSSMLNMKLPNDMRIFINKIKGGDKLYVEAGDILVSRSGTVGTSVLCGSSYKGYVASDDCIRVRIEEDYRGYVAAYLKSKNGFALLAKDAHGKVIKHLKPEDIKELPVMLFDDNEVLEINRKMISAMEKYDEARELFKNVDTLLLERLGHILPVKTPSNNVIAYDKLICQRLDPHMYEPYTNYLITQIENMEHKYLGEVAEVWGVPRFKRHYLDEGNENGIALYSSSDIIRGALEASKFISKKLNHRNIQNSLVKKDTILIPCSGTYGGILGKGTMAGELLDGKVVTQHVLRITKRNDDLYYYYVAAFLCSEKFGYPLIAATRFGKDIPELDPGTLRIIPIPDIEYNIQEEIGNTFCKAIEAQEAANIMEREAINRISELFEMSS